MRIRIISAIYTAHRDSGRSRGPDWLNNRKKLFGLCQETEIDSVGIDKGPASIESRYDEIFSIPEIAKKALEAESEGVDACVINCFGDPGVRVCRELVNIPVLGPCESSLTIASLLCDQFSVVTVLKSVTGLIRENSKIAGVSEKLASIRTVDIPVLDLHQNNEKTKIALFEEGKKALDEDGAELLILGCTGMTGMAESLSEDLGVKVIDPLPTAVKLAELIASLGLSHSKLAFPKPVDKLRVA